MYHYDYSNYLGTTEMWSACAEWNSRVRVETLDELDEIATPASEPTSISALVTLAVVVSLFLVSIGTLALGTAKVTEGAAAMNQSMALTNPGGWEDLR